ncbi:MAG: hypothetical protein HFI75_10410 [Lachnospiraceae bacterium]|nr:hypothetical protein [Lachnospiraceae bacterium]
MSFIRPVEFSGIVQRTNDISTMKQNEDNKPVQDQSNFQQAVHRQAEHTAHEVAKKDDADRNQEKFDAKEKGKGEYSRQQNQKKKQSKQPEDKVVKKKSRGFDISV